MSEEKTPFGVKVVSVLFIILYWWTAIGIIIGICLWRGRNWARITAGIMCGSFALLSFWLLAGIGGGSLSSIGGIVVNVLIVAYLFANRRADRYFGRE